MENLNQIDQSTLDNVLGGSNTNLIPESLVTMLTVGFIVLNVLSVLFFIVYVLGFVRKWKVQTAILNTQKDVAEIKAQLASGLFVQKPEPKPAPIEPTLKLQSTDGTSVQSL